MQMLEDLKKTAGRYKKTKVVALIVFVLLLLLLQFGVNTENFGLTLGVFLGAFGVFLAVLFYSSKEEARRRKEFKRISEHLGMTFSAYPKGRAKDQATPPLSLFREGRSRVVTNMLHGNSELLRFAEEFEVRIFAYEFTVGSGKSSHTSMQSVICFQSPQLNLPKFQLCPESFFKKLGGDWITGDIDFESDNTAVRFSEKYLLKAGDAAEKEANERVRALFTDEVLAFFAGQDKICVEGLSSHLCFYRARKLIEPEDIPEFMKNGFKMFQLFTEQPS